MTFKEKVSEKKYKNLAPLPFVALFLFTMSPGWLFLGIVYVTLSKVLIYQKPCRKTIEKAILEIAFLSIGLSLFILGFNKLTQGL